jgi:hypothetical protein
MPKSDFAVVGSVNTDQDFSLSFIDDSGAKAEVIILSTLMHGHKILDAKTDNFICLLQWPSGKVVNISGLVSIPASNNQYTSYGDLWRALCYLGLIKKSGSPDYFKEYPIDLERFKSVFLVQNRDADFSGKNGKVENLYDYAQAIIELEDRSHAPTS